MEFGLSFDLQNPIVCGEEKMNEQRVPHKHLHNGQN